MGEYVWFHDVSWHATYAVYFFVIGIVSGLFFFSFLSWHNEALQSLRQKAAYGSFALLVVGGFLLVGDLSQPGRFLNILNPAYLNFSSPLAWGALNIVSFGAVSAAYLFMLMKGDLKTGKMLAAIGAALALGLPIYTGYDLTVHQSRPVWNSALMPAFFVAMAMAAGSAVSSLLSLGNETALKALRPYMLWSAGAVGVCLLSLMGTTNYGGTAEELTFMIMTTGTMGALFIGLGAIAGTAAPIALMLAPFGRQQTGLALSAVLLLAGGAAMRYVILMAPQQLQTLF